jgi:hypothetical protein
VLSIKALRLAETLAGERECELCRVMSSGGIVSSLLGVSRTTEAEN